MQYTQDNDDEFHITSATTNHGWVHRIQPYTKNYEMFECPSEPASQDTRAGSLQVTDYYLNRNLAGKEHAQIRWPQNTILLGEGEASASDYNCASFSLCFINVEAKSVAESGNLRHLDGANYAFVDGHAKWFKPHQIQSRRISAGTVGFPIR